MKQTAVFSAMLLTAAAGVAGEIYVSPSGSDETATGAQDAPFKSVQAAVSAANGMIDSGEAEMTIYLAPGEYKIAKDESARQSPPFVIDGPVKLVGQGTRPSDVTLSPSYSYDWSGSYDACVVWLDHASSALVNLKIKDGMVVNWGGISSHAAGCHIASGTVSNCVISSCHSRGNNAHCGGVYLGSSAAVLTHTRVENNWCQDTQPQNWSWSRSGGVMIEGGGRVENCVIKGCHIDEDSSSSPNKYVGGVYASAGTVVNCTVIDCRAHDAGGMFIKDSAMAVNCVLAGNAIYSPDDNTGSDDHARVWSADLYYNCASDTTSPINAAQGCVVGTTGDFFTDYANGDYVPRFGSPLVNAGDSSASGEGTDYAGETRVIGSGIDIGAYELDSNIPIEITVSTSDYGTIEMPAGPYFAGVEITLTAIPNEGYRFVRWEGDVPDGQAESAELTFTPIVRTSLVPRFMPLDVAEVQYVSTTGDDANDGFTETSPKQTVAAALNTLLQFSAAGEIFIAPGEYSYPGVMVVTNAISFVGTGSAPDDVVLRNGAARDGSQEYDARVFIVDHAQASICNLTLADGATQDWGAHRSAYGGDPRGGCGTLFSGMISNCVIRGGQQLNWWSYAGGVYVGAAGLLTHSIIKNCKCPSGDASWSSEQVGGVRLDGGRMENCLITGCSVSGTAHGWASGGVRVTGGTMVNCSIIGNSCNGGVAGAVVSDSGRAVNCVLVKNYKGDTESNTAGSSASVFLNCATDSEEPLNDTCVCGDATKFFVDLAEGDYTPCYGSPLIDAGAAGYTSASVDLAGNQRVRGGAIDIGAYEDAGALITVSVLDCGFGSVEGAGEYEAGSSVTITATPNEGYRFLVWEGAPSEFVDQASFTFNPTVNFALRPRYAPTGTEPVQYVATDGSDENGGFTSEAAKRTIRAAVEVLSETYGYGTVQVAAGTYNTDSPFALTNAIKVVGMGARPTDTVLHNTRTGGDNHDSRLAVLADDGSALVNLTLDHGTLTDWGGGPSVYGTAGGGCAAVWGGTISNCVVRGGETQGWWGSVGGVHVEGASAVLTHCIIENCRHWNDDADWTSDRAGGVYLKRGLVANCLVMDCTVKDAARSSDGYGIYADGGTVANCTVLRCSGNTSYALRANTGASVYNCAVFACTKNQNEGTVISPWGGDASRFFNCATDGASPINDSCVLIDETAFLDYANAVYTPRHDGALYNAGAEVTLPSGTDLAGLPRIQGKGIDIGAYECQFSGLLLYVR